MPPSTVADLADLLAHEAELARQEWEDALAHEAAGWRLAPEHWPMAAVLLLGLVPMGVRDMGRALLREGDADGGLYAEVTECDVCR